MIKVKQAIPLSHGVIMGSSDSYQNGKRPLDLCDINIANDRQVIDNWVYDLIIALATLFFRPL